MSDEDAVDHAICDQHAKEKDTLLGDVTNCLRIEQDENRRLRTALTALQERERVMREAFEVEAEKVIKANREAKKMDCDCSGEGVGSLGGCFRCRTLNELSTFGWDFYALTPPANKGE